ncbi:MAG: response regulator, partial [Candidatus Marinimicrobia bacterium]|nr:response regulator [Candidatus Neomarinimicrobiota bacterium]
IGIYMNKIDKNKFRFEVKDTGIGLDSVQQKKLFQSFSQADGSTTRKYGGTGLGLTISKQLVELMGGKIWVESQIGIGSRFIFEIELIEKDEKKTKINLFKDKKVLVVDDNQNWQEILATLLKKFGLQVDIVDSGRHALERLQGSQNKYDLILMDWNMPELNGIETTRLINESFVPEKPPTVIMVSAFKQESIFKLAKEVNIDIFLQKPINPSILNDTLSGIFLDDFQSDCSDLNYIGKEECRLKNELKNLAGNTILLTEDNETNQEIVLGLLEESDLEIDIANNGQEAVEKYRTNPNKYGLILMDMQMPVMDGVTAAKIIREKDKNIPIIALTANAMPVDIEKTENAGMNEHLNKPIEVEKLYETLLKYLPLKSVKRKDLSAKIEELDIPRFIEIDTNIGLSHLSHNKKLFLKILKDFAVNYKDLEIERLNADEFQRTTHTIKGLSLNIGAINLHTITCDLDEKQDKTLLPEFYEKLNLVINEIEEKVLNAKGGPYIDKESVSSLKRDELFAKLKKAISTKKPTLYVPALEEIEKYDLTNEDNEFFIEIKGLVGKYKFKEAIEKLA